MLLWLPEFISLYSTASFENLGTIKIKKSEGIKESTYSIVMDEVSMWHQAWLKGDNTNTWVNFCIDSIPCWELWVKERTYTFQHPPLSPVFCIYHKKAPRSSILNIQTLVSRLIRQILKGILHVSTPSYQMEKVYLPKLPY